MLCVCVYVCLCASVHKAWTWLKEIEKELEGENVIDSLNYWLTITRSHIRARNVSYTMYEYPSRQNTQRKERARVMRGVVGEALI